MLPDITKQNVFVAHQLVGRLASDADHFERTSYAQLKCGAHALDSSLRRIMLHSTVLSIAIVAAAIGAIAN